MHGAKASVIKTMEIYKFYFDRNIKKKASLFAISSQYRMKTLHFYIHHIKSFQNEPLSGAMHNKLINELLAISV